MGRAEKYLIGDRFLVEPSGIGSWDFRVNDFEGELHEIFGGGAIKAELIKACKGDDIYWILVGVSSGSSEKSGSVVIRGNEVVFYIVLKNDQYYIKHYGQRFKGKIEEGRRKGILINGEYLEVRKKEEDGVSFGIIFLGEELTFLIEVGAGSSKLVCFPEFNKLYSGDIDVEGCWGCVNVWVLRNRMLSLYLLFGDGEEYLVYEGPKLYPMAMLPTFHRLGNIIVVSFYGKENEVVKDFRRIPGFDYMYVKRDLEGDVYISFNLRKWEKVGEADRVIFKGGGLRIGNTIYVESYTSIEAFGKFAKKLLGHQELLCFS